MRKLIYCIVVSLCFTMAAFAQKETYDIAHYVPPADWKKEIAATAVIYSRIDGGSWSQIAIYKSTASKGSIEADAQQEWQQIVLSQRTIVDKDETTKPETADGWSVISHSGVWQHNGVNVATILTTYSNGAICISILCNATAQSYLRTYQQFIKSLDFLPQSQAVTAVPATTTPVANAGSVAGLWVNYISESSGYLNGAPMLSGGYLRTEYLFNANGTYQFRRKDWSIFVKEILFVYETGTWQIHNNQLTLTPTKGAGEWWAKTTDGRTAGWGNRLKAADHPLEKTTYTFEVKYLSGMRNNYLILKSHQPTTRDGRKSNQDNQEHAFNYSHRELSKSLIDNPPGTHAGVMK